MDKFLSAKPPPTPKPKCSESLRKRISRVEKKLNSFKRLQEFDLNSVDLTSVSASTKISSITQEKHRLHCDPVRAISPRPKGFLSTSRPSQCFHIPHEQELNPSIQQMEKERTSIIHKNSSFRKQYSPLLPSNNPDMSYELSSNDTGKFQKWNGSRALANSPLPYSPRMESTQNILGRPSFSAQDKEDNAEDRFLATVVSESKEVAKRYNPTEESNPKTHKPTISSSQMSDLRIQLLNQELCGLGYIIEESKTHLLKEINKLLHPDFVPSSKAYYEMLATFGHKPSQKDENSDPE